MKNTFPNTKNAEKKIGKNRPVENDQSSIIDRLIYLGEKLLGENDNDNEDENLSLSTHPIIFIPGVGGSDLYYIEEDELTDFEKSIGSICRKDPGPAKKVWLPNVTDRADINSYIEPEHKAYGLQQGDLNKLSFIDREHGPMGIYLPLIYKLMDAFPKREIYLFSYDWRQKNEIVEGQLEKFIDHITNGTKTKVDLIAHSMGGLISSLYLEKHDHRVDRYVSFGTPYEGAPRSFNQLAAKDEPGFPGDFILKDILGVDYSISNKFDSVIQLLPTKSILERFPYQLIKDYKKFNLGKEKRSNYIENIKNNSLDYDSVVRKTRENGISEDIPSSKMIEIIADNIGKKKFETFISTAKKYREDNDLDKFVNVTKREKALFFVGTGFPTEVSAYVSFEENLCRIEEAIYTRQGDGTVPLFSATMGMDLDKLPDDLRKKFIVRKNLHLLLVSDPYSLKILIGFLK